MSDYTTYRAFHSAVAEVADSLEALFRLCEDRDFDSAAGPALKLLRQILDDADRHAGP